MRALELRLQGRVVSIKGIALFANGALGLPLRKAQPVEVVECADTLLPPQRPLLQLAQGASGIQEVTARIGPAESEQVVGGEGGIRTFYLSIFSIC
jgi:hypothetical protein